ncbi:MAG: TonB-dependent receptor [Mariniphaga sp.]
MKFFIWIVIAIFFNVFPSYSQYKIEGRVTDFTTNEGLIGVYIIIPNSNKGAISDANSHFILESTRKIDSISVSLIGYQKKIIAIRSDIVTIQLEQTTIELNQCIVTAQREYQSRKDAPSAISVLPKTIIDDTKASDISELLSKVSGVHIASFGNENQSVSIRQPLSFIRTQLVILEDEIPIVPTTIATSGNLNELNMSIVKTIEVLKGPASSIYGSEAIGGTMNFITKNPTLLPTAKISIQANNMGYKRLDFEAGNTFKKFGIFVGGYNATSSDSYRDYSDFRKTAVLLKGVYRFTDKTKLTTSISYIEHNTKMSGSLDSIIFFTNDRYNQYSFCYANDQSLRASTRLDQIWNENNKSFFTLHFRGNKEHQIPTYYIKQVYGGPPPAKYKGEYIESEYQSYDMLFQHKLKFNFLEAQLITGISLDVTPYTYMSKSIDVKKEGNLYTSYTTTDTYVQDFKADLLNSAEYIHFEISPFHKLKLSAALRYDRLDYKYNNNLASTAISGAPDDKSAFEHLSPKIGLNFNPNGKIGIYGNYSEGFAPPLFSQLYKGVIVPMLKPSSYSNYEIGGWLSFLKNKGYIDLSLYHSDGKNEIVSVLLTDGSTQNQSTGKTMHEGIEYSIKYKFFDQLEMRLSAANSIHKFVEFVDGANDYSGKIMPLAPGWVANSEITFKPKFFKNFRISAELQKIDKYYIDELNTREYNGYQIYNMRIGYMFKGVDIWLNALNLTDELYATRVQKSAYGSRAISYMPGIGRSIFLGIGYNFVGKRRL